MPLSAAKLHWSAELQSPMSICSPIAFRRGSNCVTGSSPPLEVSTLQDLMHTQPGGGTTASVCISTLCNTGCFCKSYVSCVQLKTKVILLLGKETHSVSSRPSSLQRARTPQRWETWKRSLAHNRPGWSQGGSPLQARQPTGPLWLRWEHCLWNQGRRHQHGRSSCPPSWPCPPPHRLTRTNLPTAMGTLAIKVGCSAKVTYQYVNHFLALNLSFHRDHTLRQRSLAQHWSLPWLLLVPLVAGKRKRRKGKNKMK